MDDSPVNKPGSAGSSKIALLEAASPDGAAGPWTDSANAGPGGDAAAANGNEAPAAEVAPPAPPRRVENFASVSSSIMMRLPTKNLGALRTIFTAKEGGLPLPEFLEAVINHMELPDESLLMVMISDLTDFFQMVDINGDGCMEWEEFVMFILDAVVPEREPVIMERFEPAGQVLIQPASSRCVARVVKLIPKVNKILVGVGDVLQFYAASEATPALSSLICQCTIPDETAASNPFDIIDINFIPSLDVVCVLKDNMSANMLKLRSLANITPDTITHLGKVTFTKPYTKIAIKDIGGDIRLFGIYTSRDIECWKCTIKRTEVPMVTDMKVLSKHTDYVRDIIAISNSDFKLLVSAGMDKVLHFWDLHTAKHLFSRSGPRSGIQCVAFDGARLVFAGGFDFIIYAWDLNSTLNRPIMQLSGHHAPICRIIPMSRIERCCSLDETGVLMWWDSSMTNPNDSTRHITSTEMGQDRFRSADVFQGLGVSFNSQHGCLAVAAGRKQWTYRFIDISPNESPPLAILFSVTLLTIVTVHATDVIFWSVVNAQRLKNINNIFGSDGVTKACSACLDDRGRKLYVGDSEGTISVFNCLNGLKISSMTIYAGNPIRKLIFSTDKYLIAVGGSSDVLIIDEEYSSGNERVPVRDRDPLSLNFGEWVIRQVFAHETDVHSLAFSPQQALIATLDIFGELYIWDYYTLTLRFRVECFSRGKEVGQIAFMDPYPVLLATDTAGRVYVLPLTPGTGKPKLNKLVCVSPKIDKRRQYTPDDEMDISEAMLQLQTKLTAGEQLVSSSSDTLDGTEDEVEEEKEDEAQDDNEMTGSRAKPYDKKRISRYMMKKKRECTTIFSHVEIVREEVRTASPPPRSKKARRSSVVAGAEMTALPAVGRRKSVVAVAPGGKVDSIPAETAEIPQSSSVPTTRESSAPSTPYHDHFDVSIDKLEYSSDVVLRSDDMASTKRYTEKKVIRVVCGFDDGTACTLDFTDILSTLSILPLDEPVPPPLNLVQSNGKRLFRGTNHGKDFKQWTSKYVRHHIEAMTAHYLVVWRPHDNTIVQLSEIGDRNFLVSTAGDHSVYIWGIDGAFMGTLTRGRDMDRVFKKIWNVPVDMAAREIRRAEEAKKLIRDNNLIRDDENSVESSADGRGGDGFIKLARRGAMIPTEMPKGNQGVPSDTSGNISVSPSEDDLVPFFEKIRPFIPDGPVTADLLREVTQKAASLPDRDRIMAQLANALTYTPSKKNFAELLMVLKQTELSESINNIGKGTNRRKREEKKHEPSSDLKTLTEEDASNDNMYLETIRSANELLKPREEVEMDDMENWQYAHEMEQIDAKDPTNWEMKSMNKKREYYANWFSEIDKQGLLEGRMHIVKAKINRLCPNRDFSSYLNGLRSKMKEMKEGTRRPKQKSVKFITEEAKNDASSNSDNASNKKQDVLDEVDALNNPNLDLENAAADAEARVQTMDEDIARIMHDAELRRLQQQQACARLSNRFSAAPNLDAYEIDENEESLPGGRFFRGPGFVAARRLALGSEADGGHSVTPAVWRPAGVTTREPAPSENSRKGGQLSRIEFIEQYYPSGAGRDQYDDRYDPNWDASYDQRGESGMSFGEKSPELRRSDSRKSTASNATHRTSLSKAMIEEEIARNREDVMAALEQFESIIKPMSDDQYRRSVELDKRDAPRRIKRQRKKEKLKMMDRLNARGIPTRLKPIDMKDLTATSVSTDSVSRPPIESLGEHADAESVRGMEPGWIRKATVALSATSDLHLKSNRLPTRKEVTNNARPVSTQIRITRVLDPAEVEAEEQRILAKTSFGPCGVHDLKSICTAFVLAWARSLENHGDKQARSGAHKALEGIGLHTSMDREKNKKSLKALKFSTDQTILVGDFMTSQFIARRRDLREQLSKSIGLAVKRGMYRDRVDLSGLLLLIFPLMKAADRTEACKYMVLSEREEEVKLRDSQPLTEQEEKKLRDMFDYFDSDRSGLVDPREIFEKMNQVVVDTLSILGGEGAASAVAQRTADRQMDRQGISKLISMVDTDGNDGLDFEEFCKLFRGEFL